jgi:hypothetical protein
MRDVLEEMGVNGGRMSEENLRRILTEFQERFIGQLQANNNNGVLGPAGDVPVVVINRDEANEVYPVRYYAGAFKRVPPEWRFPRVGIFDLWRQFWIGDTVRGIPPLRKLEVTDLNHLDDLPLAEDKMHGRTGKYKDKRRAATKVLSDLHYIMEFFSNKVTERNLQEPVINPESVDRMFIAVSDIFTEAERDAQKRWVSVVLNVRRRIRDERGDGEPPPRRNRRRGGR